MSLVSTPIVWTSYADTAPDNPGDYRVIHDGSHVAFAEDAASSGPARLMVCWLFDGVRRTRVFTTGSTILLQPGSGQTAVAPTDPVVDAYWASPILNQFDGSTPSYDPCDDCDCGDPPPPSGETYDHDLHRFVVVEDDVDPLETYNYPTESAAQGYIDTFGGTRDLRVGYFAVVTNPDAGGLRVFGVKRNGAMYSNILRSSASAVDAWIGIFGQSGDEVVELKETTEPA